MTTRNPRFQVNYSKSVPPQRRRRFVPRQRLIDLMDASSQDKVTLVCAPEGYGKTSLVGSWYRDGVLSDENTKSAWFRVDDNDREPDCFWENLMATLDSCWPGVAEAVDASLQSIGSSLPSHLIIALANYIVRNSESSYRYMVVFDNYERFYLSESEGQLASFMDMVPDNVHFVIVSQKFPSNKLMEADTYSVLAVIEASELSMTPGELENIAREGELKLEPGQLALLYELTEGWPLAIHVFLEELAKGADPEECLAEFGSNNRMLTEAVFAKTVESLPEPARSFLSRTGYFEAITARMCDYALERDDSDDLIRFLVRNGAFIFPASGRNQLYRYHPLFAKWLREQALQSSTKEEIRAVNHRAAFWYHQQGDWAHAGKHAIAASEATFVVELTKVVFSESRKTEEDLLEWVLDDKASEISNRPFFCVMAAWTYVFFGRPEEARRWIQRARTMLVSDGSPAEMMSNSAGAVEKSDGGLLKRLAQTERTIESKTLVLEGRYADGANAINAIRAIEGKTLDARLAMVLDQSLGEANEMGGNLDRAMQNYRSALVQARVLGYDFLIAFIRYQMSRIFMLKGEADSAFDLCEEAVGACPRDYTVYGALKSMLSRIYGLRGDLEASHHVLQQAFASVSADRNLDVYLDVCVAYIELSIAKGDYSDALYQATVALMAIADSGYAPPRGAAVRVFAKQALCYALVGDGESALSAIEARPARGYRDTEESRYLDALALAPLAEGSSDSAKHRAERLEALAADASGKDYILYELYISTALIRLWHIAGSHERALRSMRNALDIARAGRLMQPILNGGEIVKILLAESVGSRQSDYGYIKFARSVLAAFESSSEIHFPQDRDAEADDLPNGITADDLDYMNHWGLTLRELDVLRLLMRGVKRKGIAAELCTSENTVKTHIAHIYEKMNAHSVPELLRRITEYQGT